VGRFGYAEAGSDLLAAVRGAGVEAIRLSEGGEVRSGVLRLTVLWPPAAVLSAGSPVGMESGVDPNQHSLVVLAEWRHLSMLLTGDAEAEAVPIDPGPVDVLKVGHHGSEDGGLDALLARSVPELAVISVGDNSHGHPTPETLADLREHGVPVARTDLDGTVEIEADAAGWRVGP
jgi:competence protein ComEC